MLISCRTLTRSYHQTPRNKLALIHMPWFTFLPKQGCFYFWLSGVVLIVSRLGNLNFDRRYMMIAPATICCKFFKQLFSWCANCYMPTPCVLAGVKFHDWDSVFDVLVSETEHSVRSSIRVDQVYFLKSRKLRLLRLLWRFSLSTPSKTRIQRTGRV